MTRDPVEDQQPDRHGEEDPKFEPETPRAKQFADVRLLDWQMAERGRLGLVEQEDEERVEGVEGGEQEVGGDVEWNEKLEVRREGTGRASV
jgi:hypothetical protein